MEAATGVDFSDASWAIDGAGFYTEDPMRRYAYPVAHTWAQRFFSTMDRPMSVTEVVRLLRAATLDPAAGFGLSGGL
jgi:hypothetical protein